MTTRTWVLTAEGRASRIGFELDCKRCDEESAAEVSNE
jgi:phage protein U